VCFRLGADSVASSVSVLERWAKGLLP